MPAMNCRARRGYNFISEMDWGWQLFSNNAIVIRVRWKFRVAMKMCCRTLCFNMFAFFVIRGFHSMLFGYVYISHIYLYRDMSE